MSHPAVTVNDRAAFEQSINSYIAQGYAVSNKGAASAILTKKKQFSIPIAIIGFLFCGIGLVIYAVAYACMKDKTVEIRLVP